MNATYTFIRFDTATRLRREELAAKCPGWVWDETVPQFAIVDRTGNPADWPLLTSFEEAVKACAKFNKPDRCDSRPEGYYHSPIGTFE